MSDTISQLFNGLETVLGKSDEFIALHEPLLDGASEEYVVDALRSGYVSSVGVYVNKFEEKFAETCGMKYAVAVSNGTAALHVGLILAGVKANDEVLLQSLTFIASANAVTYCGAIPHFCDSHDQHFAIDPEKLDRYLNEIAEIKDQQCFNKQTGRRLSAIVPMHVFGLPGDMDGLVEVSKKWCIPIVEDAAEALGSRYDNGRHVGYHGQTAAFSFNGNKIITTGGGGALVTNDEALAKQAKHITTTAKIPHAWKYEHDQTGYNYRMPNLNAALGVAQLERLDVFLEAKRILTSKYIDAFKDAEGFSFVEETGAHKSNYWLNAIRLDQPDLTLRDEILKKTNDSGYMTRPIWTPMHQLGLFKSCPKMDMSTTDLLSNCLVNIPSSAKFGM